MNGWDMTPWKFQVYSMKGSDFRGKRVGPVCFETVGTLLHYRICIFCPQTTQEYPHITQAVLNTNVYHLMKEG